MSSSQSPVIDFYPTEFKLDINGAAYAWMGVNLLPFIDEQRLYSAMKQADSDSEKLTVQEKKRNRRVGDTLIYHANERGIGKIELKDGQSLQVFLKDS